MSVSKRFFIPREDRKLGNRYELLEPLGDGSHGTVWRAMRAEDSKIVAVKIPRAQGESTEYLKEGTPLIGQLPHPNVVAIYWMDWCLRPESTSPLKWSTSQAARWQNYLIQVQGDLLKVTPNCSGSSSKC